MKIKSLHIYPIKSVAAVNVSSLVCAERGFEGDRRYMIVDPDGVFLTQRTVPELGLIHAGLTPDGLALIANDRETFVGAPSGTTMKVRVWSTDVDAVLVDSSIDAWISDVIGQPAHLVAMPDSVVRLINPDAGQMEVSFADGYPYLVANTASLDDLNGRIPGDPISMAAFRPNLVVSGAKAWAEDTWKRLRVGDAEFEIVSACERCKITTLDPGDPRKVRRDQEPLRTLATFRRDGDGVIFASNAICLTPGVSIHIGDQVEVL
jgi:uncharacterized protein YcbX